MLHRRVLPAWWRVLPALFLHALGVGLMLPVMPVLIRAVMQTDVATAAVYGGWLTASYAALQFITAPLIGSLGDRYGRRPVLIASSAMFCVSYLLLATAKHLVLLLAAQALAGGFAAATSAGSAYIADLSEASVRAKRFGQMSALYGLGLALGPLLSAQLMRDATLGASLHLPVLIAAGLALLNAVYVWQCLPESLATPTQTKPMTQPEQVRWSGWRSLRLFAAYAGVRRLLWVTVLFHISIQSLPTLWPYYTMQKFAWTAPQVGYSLTVFGVLVLATQGVLTGFATARLGNRATVMLGLGLHGMAFIGMALTYHSTTLTMCIVPAALGMVTGPALTSALTRLLPANLQGTLQGVLASAISMAAVLTPLCMPVLFRSLIQWRGTDLAGVPYLVAASLSLLAWWLIKRTKSVSW